MKDSNWLAKNSTMECIDFNIETWQREINDLSQQSQNIELQKMKAKTILNTWIQAKIIKQKENE